MQEHHGVKISVIHIGNHHAHGMNTGSDIGASRQDGGVAIYRGSAVDHRDHRESVGIGDVVAVQMAIVVRIDIPDTDIKRTEIGVINRRNIRSVEGEDERIVEAGVDVVDVLFRAKDITHEYRAGLTAITQLKLKLQTGSII
ncbi:MAG: hypothetical protein F9K25_18950 [Candidatus Contendobacter sp.]|nr:MAG: hypothetical protein F9K25_18950 [Candidatus Contendobacter sp.]